MERQWDTTDEQYEWDECLRRRMGLVLDNLGKPKRDYELIAIWEDNSPISYLHCVALQCITLQHSTLHWIHTQVRTHVRTYIRHVRTYMFAYVRAYMHTVTCWYIDHICIYIYIVIYIYDHMYIYIIYLFIFIYLQKWDTLGVRFFIAFCNHWHCTCAMVLSLLCNHWQFPLGFSAMAKQNQNPRTKKNKQKNKMTRPTLCHYSPLGCAILFFFPLVFGFSVFWFVVGFWRAKDLDLTLCHFSHFRGANLFLMIFIAWACGSIRNNVKTMAKCRYHWRSLGTWETN